MRFSVVLVHYHTPDLAAAAVAALHADLATAAASHEIVVVDNGSDAAERARLSRLPATIVAPGANLGYAGAANLGVASTSGDLVAVMNPDVLVLPGCLAALAAALRSEADIAGPRMYWDGARRLLLPPAEPRTRRWELLALLAARHWWWAAIARRRFRSHARRHWRAGRPLRSSALSGSLLAFRRDAFQRVGPFDAGFPLYFEETDWLRRARQHGLRVRYVPAAEAVHHYARSSAREPRAAGWFEESARRFRDRHYGRWFRRILEALAGRPPGPTAANESAATAAHARDRLPSFPDDGLDLSTVPLPVWVEVSPNAAGFPAAAERVTAATSRWRLPAEIEQPGRLRYCLVTDGGRELAAGSRARGGARSQEPAA